MKKCNLKSAILFSFVFLSQVHVFFIGVNFKIEWLINNKIKSASFAVFLFFVYFRFAIFSYFMMKPKGVSKDVPLFLFIISVLDLLHFTLLSSYGYGELKILVSLFVFGLYKYFYR